MSNIILINKIAIDLSYQGYDRENTVLRLQTLGYGVNMEEGEPIDLEEVKNIL